MTNKRIVVGILALGLVFIMSGCGANPKGLAKQTYDLGMEALGALSNPAKAAELEKKAEDIEKKIAKLSASDRAVYEEELSRLAGQGFGDLLDTAAQQANDLLNLLGGNK